MWNQPFQVGKQHGFVFAHKDYVSIRNAVSQDPHYLLFVVLVTVVVTILVYHYPYHSSSLPSGGLCSVVVL
jgi:hypothetical protein